MSVWMTSCVHYGKVYYEWDHKFIDYGCDLNDEPCDWVIGDASNCDYFEEKSGCFMTTACVDFMGMPDDCVELETLRKFRDEKLKRTQGGKALISEYYRVAPLIVKAIDASPKKEQYYQDIYKSVCSCVDKVNKNEDEEAIKAYWMMFNKYRIIFGF